MKLTKKYLYLALVIFILLGVIGYLLLGKRRDVKNSFPVIVPTEMIIPTIDNSVMVNLTNSLPGKEVLLTIENIPTGTEIIEYELSYQTAEQGLQGVLGSIKLNNDKRYEKRLVLGTCSSGVCVYHKVVEKIKLSLKFIGDYGERIFDEEYKI